MELRRDVGVLWHRAECFMQRVAVVASLLVIGGVPPLLAVQFPVGPAFEVVSIKPSNPDAVGANVPPVGGRFSAGDVSLRRLVQMAYEVFDFQIDGGPDWQTSRHFDIQARAADPAAGSETTP